MKYIDRTFHSRRAALGGTVLLSLASLLGSVQVSNAEYTYYIFEGYRYTITHSAGTVLEARAEALALGGDLVSINSAAEEQFLESTFGNQSDDYLHEFWIGLEALNGQWGNWGWMNGDPVTYTDWGDWGVPEPNNATQGQAENNVVLYFYPQFGWADVPGSRQDRGIVEIPNLGDPPVVADLAASPSSL